MGPISAGMLLLSIGIAGVVVGVSVLGVGFLPWTAAAASIVAGSIFIVVYVMYARRKLSPVIDLTLLRLPTFRASLTGGFLFRLGVGALPFLLPLMLQLGFGMTPFNSGLVTFTGAAGAIAMKAFASTILRRFGFRTILVVNCLVSGAFLAACGAFTAATPVAVMVTVLLIGGFFRSLQFTCINTIAYADVEQARVSRATSLTAAAQQLALSAGVAFGALTVQSVVHLRGGSELLASDFAPAFIAVAAISTLSLVIFARLPADAGSEISGRKTSDV
jgi:MFS family permease